ncbi:hypothetical protein IG610_19175 [Pectobacterium sp. FL63-S17]|uniref:hypothetical protein n=1 Tax=Pectobacterium quasiaquaticum TaxID=2774015 RepID=UPI0018737FF9|nr:hypothetical protein [Pectobacterium quasiaquaticum]MBE5212173.1 hypothetical protein [Pectobacterium quasiaquaticum]
MGLPPQPARLPQLAWGSRAGSAGAGGKESASVGLRRSGAQCRREPQVCMTTPHWAGCGSWRAGKEQGACDCDPAQPDAAGRA